MYEQELKEEFTAQDYVPPMLAEVGEFSEDTLGYGNAWDSKNGLF
uniref:Lasso peptide n=1 Tax=Streptomyces huasconensis TaxID=1854574 RepID=A0A4Y5QXE0_9ACTN|nr:lasso peptide precursor [Streptomyces huasconensis]